MLREYAFNEVGSLKVHGRTNGCLNPLTLFWTASGFEVNVTGSELWMEVEGDYSVQEPWISTRINGAWVSRQMVNRGRQWICLFRGRNPKTVKNVRILKDMQAMSEDPDHLLQVHALRTDGAFLPVPEKALRLEFIGDSITDCGDGYGIGFTFKTYNTGDMLHSLHRAIYAYNSDKEGWGVLVDRAMACDNSWGRSANEYIRLYKQILKG